MHTAPGNPRTAGELGYQWPHHVLLRNHHGRRQRQRHNRGGGLRWWRLRALLRLRLRLNQRHGGRKPGDQHDAGGGELRVHDQQQEQRLLAGLPGACSRALSSRVSSMMRSQTCALVGPPGKSLGARPPFCADASHACVLCHAVPRAGVSGHLPRLQRHQRPVAHLQPRPHCGQRGVGHQHRLKHHDAGKAGRRGWACGWGSGAWGCAAAEVLAKVEHMVLCDGEEHMLRSILGHGLQLALQQQLVAAIPSFSLASAYYPSMHALGVLMITCEPESWRWCTLSCSTAGLVPDVWHYGDGGELLQLGAHLGAGRVRGAQPVQHLRTVSGRCAATA